MSTQGINSNSNIQQAPPQQDYNQQSRQVSERQANDFSERMAKEKSAKEKNSEEASRKAAKDGDKQPTDDASLLARNKKAVGERAPKGDEKPLTDKSLSDSNKRLTNEPRSERHAGEQHAKTSGDKKPSLEELLAERSKPLKEKDTSKEESVLLSARESSEHSGVTTLQSPVKVDAQIREIQQASTVKEVDAALQKLATQIQVSAKDALNGAEVRITLKDSVLPGTEIRIQRHGGELTVTLNTTSAEAGNFLASHEANLQRILAERFSNDKVQVNVNMTGSDNQDQDGRSRNQYTADDNENESDNE